MKQKKGKGKKAGGWDQVPIEEEFLAEKEMENLISLEVLTDYQIVKRPDGIMDIVTAVDKSKKNKRKLPDSGEEDEDLTPSENSDLDNGSGSEDEEDVQSNSEDDEGVGEMEIADVEPSPTKQPKKKLKLELEAKKSKKQSGKEATERSQASASTSNWKVVESPQSVEKDVKKGANVQSTKKTVKSKIDSPKSKKQKQIIKSETEGYEEMGDKSENVVSMEAWIKAGVQDPVLKALREAGFHQPTQIQESTLPAAIMGRKDVVGAAETGSGKTLAFAIPIILGILQNRATSGKDNSLQALILTPTRELAVQIKKHFDVAAKYARIKTVVIVGGLATQKQERLLRGQPEVIIATPGRLWELVKEGEAHLATLDKIRYLAVDETDRMVERGHFQELEGILGTLNKDETLKSQRQNFVFSATLSFTHDPPQRLHNKKSQKQKQPRKISAKEKLKQIMDMIGVRPNPKVVDITSTKGTCETLQEMQINCPAHKKDYYMYYFLIKHPGRTIVFCNSINTVRRLTNLFFLLKCGQVLPLHSEMQQKMRLRNLEKFAKDDTSVLIATDVAARGLDVVDIQHVVHYEIPKTAESYIHRSGRTARAFKGGIAIVLVEPSEIGRLKNIFRSLNRDPDKMLPLFSIDGGVFTKLKARVDEADKVEKFEHTVRKRLADMNWMDKAKKDMDMDIEDSDEDKDMDEDCEDGERRNRRNLLDAKKKLEGYKRTLNKLLADNSIMHRLGLMPT